MGGDYRAPAEKTGEQKQFPAIQSHQAGLVNGFLGVQVMAPLDLEGEIHHHDGVLFHNSDEQNDSDHGNDGEFEPGHLERQKRSEPGTLGSVER
jgi:hypothetical protein